MCWTSWKIEFCHFKTWTTCHLSLILVGMRCPKDNLKKIQQFKSLEIYVNQLCKYFYYCLFLFFFIKIFFFWSLSQLRSGEGRDAPLDELLAEVIYKVKIESLLQLWIIHWFKNKTISPVLSFTATRWRFLRHLDLRWDSSLLNINDPNVSAQKLVYEQIIEQFRLSWSSDGKKKSCVCVLWHHDCAHTAVLFIL